MENRKSNENSGDAGPGRPVRERMADLVGLLCLLGVATLVYVATGPEAFAAVTAVGASLFAGWRGRGERE